MLSNITLQIITKENYVSRNKQKTLSYRLQLLQSNNFFLRSFTQGNYLSDYSFAPLHYFFLFPFPFFFSYPKQNSNSRPMFWVPTQLLGYWAVEKCEFQLVTTDSKRPTGPSSCIAALLFLFKYWNSVQAQLKYKHLRHVYETHCNLKFLRVSCLQNRFWVLF